MNRLYSVTELLLDAKPVQFELLEQLVARFAETPKLINAFVRGSIAHKTVDRASDVDFAVVWADRDFSLMVALAEDVVRSAFNVLFPAWKDTIVKDFGGVGYTFLIEYRGSILSIDIYHLPESAVPRFVSACPYAKLIYSRDGSLEPEIETETPLVTAPTIADAAELALIEVLTLAVFIVKHITRRQRFLNYSVTYLFNAALCRLVRAIHDPLHLDYGWYHIEQYLGTTVGGRSLLARLGSAVDMPINDLQSLSKHLGVALEVISENRNDIYERHRVSIEFFLEYFCL